MKRFIFILPLLLLVSLLCGQDRKRKEPLRLKVVTANLLYLNKNGAEVSRVLLEQRADLIVLQEWNGINMERESIVKAGFRFLIDKPATDAAGIALLVRGTFKTESSYIPADRDEPCALPMVTATILLPGGARFTFIGVHIPPPLKACEKISRGAIERLRSRIAEGRLLIDMGSGRKGDPVILAGDFNTLSGDELMNSFKNSGLTDSHLKGDPLGGGTWSPIMNTAKFARVDYIFTAPLFDILSSVTFELPGSDHKGVAALLILRPPPEGERPQRR